MSQSTSFTCPRCQGPVQDQGNSPGGDGVVIVVLETDSCSDCYDGEISEFHCPACQDTFFMRPNFGAKEDPAQRDAAASAVVRQASSDMFAKAGLDLSAMKPDPARPGLWVKKD